MRQCKHKARVCDQRPRAGVLGSIATDSPRAKAASCLKTRGFDSERDGIATAILRLTSVSQPGPFSSSACSATNAEVVSSPRRRQLQCCRCAVPSRRDFQKSPLAMLLTHVAFPQHWRKLNPVPQQSTKTNLPSSNNATLRERHLLFPAGRDEARRIRRGIRHPR
jgi:hypothetical protein